MNTSARASTRALGLLLALGCSSTGSPDDIPPGNGNGATGGSNAVGSGGGSATGGTGGAGGASGTGGGAGGASGNAAGGTTGGAGAGGNGGSTPTDAGKGGGPSCTSSMSLRPGDTNGSVVVAGVTRTYIAHVPASYTGTTPVPLVVDFHPLFGTGALERNSSGYAALADREGFIAVFPNGVDNAWNVGPCCTTSRTLDDVGFARALVDRLKSDACIDPKQVYAVGFSMGGGMSHYLACHAADVFAAVAPAAFDLLTENEPACRPSRPIPQIAFRGTADLIVPYAGGASNPPNGLPVTIHFLGAQATFEAWARLNGCTGAPVDSGAGCRTYSQCQAGTQVALCTKQGGGHETGDAQRGWDMLKRHSLP